MHVDAINILFDSIIVGPAVDPYQNIISFLIIWPWYPHDGSFYNANYVPEFPINVGNIGNIAILVC